MSRKITVCSLAIVALLVVNGCVLGASGTGAPTGLTTEVRSSSEILLTWDRQEDADAFRVERKDGEGAPFREVGVTAPLATGHLNTGLSLGATYTWRVRACVADRCSRYSEEVSAATHET